jgi:hypothetical protein
MPQIQMTNMSSRISVPGYDLRVSTLGYNLQPVKWVKFQGYDRCRPESIVLFSVGYPILEEVTTVEGNTYKRHDYNLTVVPDPFHLFTKPTPARLETRGKPGFTLPPFTPFLHTDYDPKALQATIPFGGNHYIVDVEPGFHLWGGLTLDQAWKVAEEARRLNGIYSSP